MLKGRGFSSRGVKNAGNCLYGVGARTVCQDDLCRAICGDGKGWLRHGRPYVSPRARIGVRDCFLRLCGMGCACGCSVRSYIVSEILLAWDVQ